MSVEIMPLGFSEAATVPIANQDAFSSGANLSGNRHTKLGVIVEITAKAGADDFDIIVQTRLPGTTDWLDTNSRINNVTTNGAKRLEVTDTVFDNVRIKFAAGGVDVQATTQTRWLSEQSITAL